MPRTLVIPPGVTVPDGALTWRFSRSSGPGGQSVNTADSRVELSVDLEAIPWQDEAQRDRALERLRTRRVGSVVTVVASEHRAQLRNRDAALTRLVALLTNALAPPDPPRRPTRPSRASRERRVRAERRRQEIKALRRRPDPR
ncbi:MAG: alternative ribosome rescue aminoacyl-tRNA hydrolase ArfB [Cellulomonas sp.]